MVADALIRLAARHLGSYLELGAAAAGEFRSALARRLSLALAGLVIAIVGLAAVWTGGLLVLWSGPWRMAYVFASGLLLLGLAAWLLCAALGASAGGKSSGVLKSELRKDMELFQQWKNTL